MDLREYADVVREFCAWLQDTPHPDLKGITDGKAIGTYIERHCREFFENHLKLPSTGSSASGMDLPEFDVDVKATFLSQPQSSSPFRSIEEIIFGLPYNVLLIVHTKKDTDQGACIQLHRVSYIPKELTADHRVSRAAAKLALRMKAGEITHEKARVELMELLGLEEGGQIQVTDAIIDRLAKHPPREGVITLTLALQWRLNYNKFKRRDPIAGVVDFLR